MLLVAAIIPAISGCESRRPIGMIEVCLSRPGDIERFEEKIRSIGNKNRLKFFDRSLETEQEAEAINQVDPSRTYNKPVINMSLRRWDGLGLSASNINSSDTEAVIGFTSGWDSAEGDRFSEATIEEIGAQWHVARVPQDRGARGGVCGERSGQNRAVP